MVEITWTLQAQEDLDGICEYIGRDSENYASIFAQRIINAIEKLNRFPEMGRIVPEKNNPQIRELILSPYRIIYRLDDDIVLITTIIHGSRQLLI
jgi:addiction module RelE/StbE family toxin